MPKPEQPSNGDESRISFAAGFHSATEFTKDGVTNEYTVIGTDQEAVDHVVDQIQESTGGTLYEPKKKGSGKSHGMPGVKNWGAKWQPKGPNLSWQRPNEN
jgi:hypothetical protein